MNEMQILFEFLASQLPEAVVTQALAYTAVTAALVGLLRRIPWVEARKQVAAPVLSLVIGQGFGWVTVGFDPANWLLAVGAGLVIALAAIGGYSGAKNVVQSARRDAA
ncbi:hypothetical protein [Symbiobacterium terraclitae]|uniref:hypothetical protein n=1 Tax=Symbiobacterium terraclitae TaxID=557451 RepID=UPI0035B4FCCD